MDALKGYTAGSDSEEDGEITAPTTRVAQFPIVNLSPAIAFTPKPHSTVALYDERNREIKVNPKYDELFRSDVGFKTGFNVLILFQAGPANPFKSQSQLAKKNMLTGFVEAANFDDYHFSRAQHSYNNLGYAEDPSAHAGKSYIGDTKKASDEKVTILNIYFIIVDEQCLNLLPFSR
jgi:hypothetical protein